MFWDQTLTELFRKGGFAMWPLLTCSVLAIAIIMERGLYFWKLRFDYDQFVEELKTSLMRGKRKDVLLLCRQYAHPVPRMAEQYIRHLGVDNVREHVVRHEGSLALEKVESRLRGLASIAHIAPLLGLLGTVTGLVTAFHKIELLNAQVMPSDLAAGIWEALITTVYGLVVAIPCMAAYHGFESAADNIARRMQFIVSELDEFFGKHSKSSILDDRNVMSDAEVKAVG